MASYLPVEGASEGIHNSSRNHPGIPATLQVQMGISYFPSPQEGLGSSRARGGEQVRGGLLLRSLGQSCHWFPSLPHCTAFWKVRSEKSFSSLSLVFYSFSFSLLYFCLLSLKEEIIATLQFALQLFYQVFRFFELQNSLFQYYFHCSAFLVFLFSISNFFSQMLKCPIHYHTFIFSLVLNAMNFPLCITLALFHRS